MQGLERVVFRWMPHRMNFTLLRTARPLALCWALLSFDAVRVWHAVLAPGISFTLSRLAVSPCYVGPGHILLLELMTFLTAEARHSAESPSCHASYEAVPCSGGWQRNLPLALLLSACSPPDLWTGDPLAGTRGHQDSISLRCLQSDAWKPLGKMCVSQSFIYT